MGTEGTRMELDFPKSVVTAGGRVEIYPNGPDLESVVAKLFEANHNITVHIIVEEVGGTQTVCNFVDPNESERYRWPCHQYVIDGICPEEAKHEEKRNKFLQPDLLELA